MFPEITRDDVFRLETRRLWLRWPAPADAAALTSMAGRDDLAAMTVQVPHPYPSGEADREIARWRSLNQAGRGLALLLTGREADRTPFGVVAVEPGGALFILLRPDHGGQGLATEAVQAIVDATFTLSPIREVSASVRVVNPAARRVFERCGFAYEATVLHGPAAQGGMVACDRFRLDRKAWASLKLWRMPIMDRTPPHPVPDGPTPAAAACL